MVRIRNVKDCRRLLAKLIHSLQKDEIKEGKARTLAYLAIKYNELYRSDKLDELETRIKELEYGQNNRTSKQN